MLVPVDYSRPDTDTRERLESHFHVRSSFRRTVRLFVPGIPVGISGRKLESISRHYVALTVLSDHLWPQTLSKILERESRVISTCAAALVMLSGYLRPKFWIYVLENDVRAILLCTATLPILSGCPWAEIVAMILEISLRAISGRSPALVALSGYFDPDFGEGCRAISVRATAPVRLLSVCCMATHGLRFLSDSREHFESHPQRFGGSHYAVRLLMA